MSYLIRVENMFNVEGLTWEHGNLDLIVKNDSLSVSGDSDLPLIDNMSQIIEEITGNSVIEGSVYIKSFLAIADLEHQNLTRTLPNTEFYPFSMAVRTDDYMTFNYRHTHEGFVASSNLNLTLNGPVRFVTDVVDLLQDAGSTTAALRDDVTVGEFNIEILDVDNLDITV